MFHLPALNEEMGGDGKCAGKKGCAKKEPPGRRRSQCLELCLLDDYYVKLSRAVNAAYEDLLYIRSSAGTCNKNHS
jgi:hypothetical protein